MVKDKRVFKTRAGIRKSFMLLCKEKNIEDITVSALSECAQINRSTFYLHYSDVNAVLKDIESEIEIQISSIVDNIDINSLYESTYTTFNCIADKLNENSALLNYILDSKSSQYITGRLKEMFITKTLSSVTRFFPDIEKEKVIFYITFLVAGIIDSSIGWAHSDKRVPLDEFIKTLSQLTKQILKNIKELN